MEQTVRKAFDVLEALAKSREPRRLTDLSRELTLTKPNVYRLLSTLSELGYVSKEETTSRYSATLKLYEIAQGHVQDPRLINATSPQLKALADSTHHSTQAAIYDDGYAYFVNRHDVEDGMKPMVTLHSRVPAVVTSAGKAMLAWKTESEIKHALTLVKRYTATTRTQKVELERDLQEARTNGYATVVGEWREGVGGISAPVRNEDGAVVASLGVWGAESTLFGARKDEIGKMVVDAAAQASRDLGFAGR